MEAYKTRFLFHAIHANGEAWKSNDSYRKTKQYYIMMECQVFHHIDTEIIGTIKKLETVDTKQVDVRTLRLNILDLIPGADSRTEQMLQEYQQLGLFFTYNIDIEPAFCYRSHIVSSLIMLESVAETISMAFSNGLSLNSLSMELKNRIVDDVCCTVCSIETIGDESLLWISRCISIAIITGLRSTAIIRDVSSLVTMHTAIVESIYTVTEKTTEFANSQTNHIVKFLESMKQEINRSLSLHENEISMFTTNVAMNVVKEKIKQTIQEEIAPGKQLHRELLLLSSQSSTDHKKFVDFIRAFSSQLCDIEFQTSKLENIANKLKSKTLDDSITAAQFKTKISTAASKIEIGLVIKKFSALLNDKLKVLSHKTNVDDNFDVEFEKLEATKEVLASVWSDNIQGVLQRRIKHSLIYSLSGTRKEWNFFHAKAKGSQNLDLASRLTRYIKIY